jgi:teichuronic acid biosynthesis glycosyltransferase TuaH
LTARSNVTWVGEQPFSALPGLLAHARVGLVPYADTPFNRASFPLKTLEYLAAGLPVVATGLPATRWLGAGPDLITIADGPTAFADAVARASSVPLIPSRREARRRFARAHSYDRRAIDLLAALDRRISDRGRPVARSTMR